MAERKKSLAAMLANGAVLGAGRMEETIGKASLRDATIATGVATDKVLALTSQTAALQIAAVVLPTPEEKAERAPRRCRAHAPSGFQRRDLFLAVIGRRVSPVRG